MRRKYDDPDEWDDHPEPGDDEEQEALTADIATILAGKTVVPGAIAWWRTRGERRAHKEAGSPRWWQL